MKPIIVAVRVQGTRDIKPSHLPPAEWSPKIRWLSLLLIVRIVRSVQSC